MKWVKGAAMVVLILIVIYFLGPRPALPAYDKTLPTVPSIDSLEYYIVKNEAAHRIKPDNEARIIWNNDSLRNETDYAVVYLHGFSASQEEGDPVHTTFAKTFGCNLYLSRLSDHGIDTTEAMALLTADRLWNSAKQAYAIGRKLGKKIILMGTSTGASLALRLAAEYPDIAGLILLSPNIAINDPNAWLLNNRWGLQIARTVKGKYNHARDTTEIYGRYWYYQYRMEAAVQLEEFLESSMKESLFRKIDQPLLMLYYYRDEEHQDPVVKVSAMKRMFRQISTPAHQKREKAIPGAGDHVIGSYIKSADLSSVIRECERFATEILKLRPQ